MGPVQRVFHCLPSRIARSGLGSPRRKQRLGLKQNGACRNSRRLPARAPTAVAGTAKRQVLLSRQRGRAGIAPLPVMRTCLPRTRSPEIPGRPIPAKAFFLSLCRFCGRRTVVDRASHRGFRQFLLRGSVSHHAFSPYFSVLREPYGWALRGKAPWARKVLGVAVLGQAQLYKIYTSAGRLVFFQWSIVFRTADGRGSRLPGPSGQTQTSHLRGSLEPF